MRLAYSRHARRRMRRRTFTEEDVGYCLDHILHERRDEKGNRRCSSRLDDGRGIIVVLDDRVTPPLVITVIAP
ncbi:MAG: DUF4258 domain-containing protein [Chloroflexi bacterium]|nr:DUF4258 domain-containing protein [Chloroflexota bacterium]